MRTYESGEKLLMNVGAEMMQSASYSDSLSSYAALTSIDCKTLLACVRAYFWCFFGAA